MLKSGLTIFWQKLKIENSEDNILTEMKTENILSTVKVNNTVGITSWQKWNSNVKTGLAIFSLKIENSEDNILTEMKTDNILSTVKSIILWG
jgi:hypothetical protein